DDRRWHAVTVVPGRRPWDALRELDLQPPADRGILVVVDQLEELVTVADRAQAERVAELLVAIADGIPGVKALVAVRGDFLTRVATLPGLDRAITRGLHLLRVLSPA